MAIGILLVIVAVAVGVAVGLNGRKKTQEGIEQGIMVNRGGAFDPPFYELESTFVLCGDWDTVWGALRKADYHGAISSGEKQEGLCAVIYKGASFSARFSMMDSDSEQTQTYRFRFMQWQERNGLPYGKNLMNILLTTIEKTLISIDPNTQVSTKRVDFSTKSKFF